MAKLRNCLVADGDGFDQLLTGLRGWPAIFVLLATDAVAGSYSPKNEHAVYGPLLTMFGRQDGFTPTERRRLWREFHRACQQLRFAVNLRDSGVGYIVDELLHQVGLPPCFVEQVTALMVATTEAIGRPAEDDPDATRVKPAHGPFPSLQPCPD